MSRPIPPVPPSPPGGPANTPPGRRRWWLIGAAVAGAAAAVAVLVSALGDDEDPKREACAYYADRIQEVAEATEDRAVHARRIDAWARASDDAEFQEAAAELLAIAEAEYDQSAWFNGIIDFGIACYGLPEGPEPSP